MSSNGSGTSRERPESTANLSPRIGRQSSASASQDSRRRALLRNFYNPSSSGLGNAQENAQQQFEQLYNHASLKDLLHKDAEIRNETAELESERQGLVYTRYHDLLDAAETIEKVRQYCICSHRFGPHQAPPADEIPSRVFGHFAREPVHHL